MSSIKVHAGDFKKYGASITFGQLHLVPQGGKAKAYSVKDIETLELASEESVIKVGGAAGWGVVGAVALGPVGLLADQFAFIPSPFFSFD